jgi:hypothetical protein
MLPYHTLCDRIKLFSYCTIHLMFVSYTRGNFLAVLGIVNITNDKTSLFRTQHNIGRRMSLVKDFLALVAELTDGNMTKGMLICIYF